MRADFKHILVAIDFGESSDEAMDLGIDLARKFEASLTLVHVYEIPAYAFPQEASLIVDTLTSEAARSELERTLAKVQARVPGAQAILRKGAVAAEILALVDEAHPDLVVMGTHGRRGISRTVLGSVAEKVVRQSPKPVLTVRRSAAAP